MPALIIHALDGRSAVVDLSSRPLILGRAETCDVVLRHDAEVSREHARIWLDENGRVFVTDMNSKNGTRVDDGEPFRNTSRPARRAIRIGEHEITITGSTSIRALPPAAVAFTADQPDATGNTRFFPSSRGLDLNQQRLSLLMSLADRLGGAFERRQMLQQALDACCEALHFERGLIVLKAPRGEVEMPITRNVERDENGVFKVSRTLINRALVHGERAIVNNPAADLDGRLTESLVRFPICSALCVPIIHRDEILGVIYGDRVTRAATYTAEDVDFLAAIAQQVGVGLAHLRLLRDYVRLERMEAELAAARQIQQDFLPAAPLKTPHLEIAGYNRPCSAVGGDCFDYIDLGDNHVGFVIADVTGHGLGAALVMANFQAAVYGALTTNASLPHVARRVNQLVHRNTPSGVFITAILGKVDVAAGIIEFISAGHPGPLALRAGDWTAGEKLNSLPLGIDPDESFTVQEILPNVHGGVVLFFTDGLIESPSPDGTLLGVDPIKQALANVAQPTAQNVLESVLRVEHAHVAGGQRDDDLTLLAIQLNPVPAHT